MAGADATAAASNDRVSIGVCVDRAVPVHPHAKLRAHRRARVSPHEIRKQIAEPLLDVRVREEYVREPVHARAIAKCSFIVCGSKRVCGARACERREVSTRRADGRRSVRGPWTARSIARA